MPRRLTLTEVKNFIENVGDELISEEYKNVRQKLKIKCQCGQEFERDFHHFKTGQYYCLNCKYKKSSELNRKDFQEILQEIADKSCQYISGEYINNKSKLILRCPCGRIFEKAYFHFHNGQITCPVCSQENASKQKIIYNEEYTLKLLKERKMTLLNGEIKDASSPLTCQCSNGHIFVTKMHNFINNKYGCPECAILANSGSGHWNYQGGVSDISDDLRKSLKDWKKEVLKRNSYECVLTGQKTDFVVHHLKGFNILLQESLDELNLTLENQMLDYSSEEYLQLRKKLLEKHGVQNGITISTEVHNFFHSLYGKGNNSKQQFLDFVEKYYPDKKQKIVDKITLF